MSKQSPTATAMSSRRPVPGACERVEVGNDDGAPAPVDQPTRSERPEASVHRLAGRADDAAQVLVRDADPKVDARGAGNAVPRGELVQAARHAASDVERE